MKPQIFCRPVIVRMLYWGYRVREAFRVRSASTRRALQHRSDFYLELWREAADRMGASSELLKNEIIQIRLGNSCTYVQQNTTAMDRAIVMTVAKNKPLVHRLLTRHGLQVPAHLEFNWREVEMAAEFIEQSACKCVVKPANGGGGRGVTTGITGRLALAQAVGTALVYGEDLMIERQVEGEVYRLLYLEGVLLDAVLRRPSAVLGDGVANVRKLIRLENSERLRQGPACAHALIVIDADLRSTLAQQGFTLASVPAHGMAVTLKNVINDNSQRDNVSAKHLLCRSIIEDGAAAAAVIGIKLAGIDVITSDPSVPLIESGGVILEVNTTPSYHHHYYKRDGAYPVALHLLPVLLGHTEAGSQPALV